MKIAAGVKINNVTIEGSEVGHYIDVLSYYERVLTAHDAATPEQQRTLTWTREALNKLKSTSIAHCDKCDTAKLKASQICKACRKEPDTSYKEKRPEKGSFFCATCLKGQGTDCKTCSASMDNADSAVEHYRRFTKNGSVVTDHKTNLQWIAGPDKDITWNEANAWVEKISLDSYPKSGWRMPTREEVKSLHIRGLGPHNMTPLLKTTGWFVWSGEVKDSLSAWVFCFGFGYDFWTTRRNSDDRRGFAVREVQETKHKPPCPACEREKQSIRENCVGCEQDGENKIRCRPYLTPHCPLNPKFDQECKCVKCGTLGGRNA